MTEEIKFWWLSYASEESFLGAAIIPAAEFLDACKISKALGLSPGGEVAGAVIPKKFYPHISLDKVFVLLNEEQTEQLRELLEGEYPNE